MQRSFTSPDPPRGFMGVRGFWGGRYVLFGDIVTDKMCLLLETASMEVTNLKTAYESRKGTVQEEEGEQ